MSDKFELINLNVEVRGEVVASNFREFRELLSKRLLLINQDLKNDEDFGQAENDVKSMKDVECVISEAKETALKQAEQLHRVFAEMDECCDEVRKTRIHLEKQIKQRKEQLKADLLAESLMKINLDSHKARDTFRSRILDAMKGKRTLSSMHKAIEVELTAINSGIAQTRKVLDDFEQSNGKSLIMDRNDLELKDCAVVAADLQRRIELKKAEDERREAEAKRKQAEAEAAKAKEETKAAEAKAQGVPLPTQTVSAKEEVDKTATPEIEAQAEWDAFKEVVYAAFGKLKPAKGSLEYHVNQKRAQRFAEAVNAAWKEANDS